jgi:hypothetical protein
MVQKRPPRVWGVPPQKCKKTQKMRNILKNGPQKWSHATIKNLNEVYGNKRHVKQWFKK